MKLKSIVVACSGALAALAGSQALAQAAFDVPEVTIYVSGASAPQNTINSVATSLFNPGFHTFFDNAGTVANPSVPASDGRLYRAYFGTIKTDATIPSSLHGKTAMIINRAKGGSGWGVQPVALGAPIATLGISAGNCALNGAQYRCAEVGSDSSANAANLVPDAGVSDLGPRFFLPSLNVEPQFPNALSPAQLSSLTIRPLQGLGMGFAATNAVANTTTLTRSNVLGMLTGTYDTWNRIDGTAAGVTVCRRVPGSGTQASYNWYMNNFPCGLGVATGASGGNDPLRMIDSAGGLTANAGTTANPDILNYDANSITVVENSSSGEVRGCLAAANNGGVHNFNDETGRKVRITFPAGAKAIGVLSLDSAGQENGWAFRNAQGAGTFNVTTQASTGGPNTGAAPSQANMKNGAYDFVAEVTGQFRTSVLSGDKLTLTNALFDRLADATILAGISNVGVRNANMGLPVGVNLPNISNANVMLGFRGGNQCAPMAPQ